MPYFMLEQIVDVLELILNKPIIKSKIDNKVNKTVQNVKKKRRKTRIEPKNFF